MRQMICEQQWGIWRCPTMWENEDRIKLDKHKRYCIDVHIEKCVNVCLCAVYWLLMLLYVLSGPDKDTILFTHTDVHQPMTYA